MMIERSQSAGFHRYFDAHQSNERLTWRRIFRENFHE